MTAGGWDSSHFHRLHRHGAEPPPSHPLPLHEIMRTPRRPTGRWTTGEEGEIWSIAADRPAFCPGQPDQAFL